VDRPSPGKAPAASPLHFPFNFVPKNDHFPEQMPDFEQLVPENRLFPEQIIWSLASRARFAGISGTAPCETD
jgi:hypothetical protein